jgi:hypothetical protein
MATGTEDRWIESQDSFLKVRRLFLWLGNPPTPGGLCLEQSNPIPKAPALKAGFRPAGSRKRWGGGGQAVEG